MTGRGAKARPGPSHESDDGTIEPIAFDEGGLLFAGERADGSWWYELASGTNYDGCFGMIYGGSFDAGDSVRFSSGLRLPKAPGFNVRGGVGEPVLSDDEGFPGHDGDGICIDEQGRALWFERFIGR